MTKIVFDVGANNGISTIAYAEDPYTTVYRFEPTPRLAQILREQPGLNLVTVETAVSDFEGTADFFVAGQADWGCSSLLEFSEKSKTEWKERYDFVVTEKIQVKVIRLDNYIEQNGIERIDYFHCDAQGSDLRVLKGMGQYINLINEGVIEAANENKQDILYKGQNTLEECREYLESFGFEIFSVESNDRDSNEVNIRFRKP